MKFMDSLDRHLQDEKEEKSENRSSFYFICIDMVFCLHMGL